MFRNLYRVLKINERGGVKMLWTPLKGFIDGFEEFETIKSEVYLNPFKII